MATPTLRYLEEIPIDINNTLLQLLGRFQTVKDGLPELLKNAKDQYARLGITEKGRRVILVLVNSTGRSVGVLDFAGAAGEAFRRWQTWSDPAAGLSDRASDIESGHGNGGKAFMVRGSSTTSFLESCSGGRRTKMGFQNDPRLGKMFYPAHYIEDGKAIDDVAVSDVRAALMRVLRGLGTKLNDLPTAAREVFAERNAYTIAQVNGIADWQARRDETIRREVAEMPKNLVSHPQAALTVETCSVYLVVDGVCWPAPLVADYPEPLPGFETAVRILIPEVLPDPRTGDDVSTGAGNAENKYLELRTSRRSLRMEETRPLNVIRVRNERNVVDNWSVADLHSRAESAFIFGTVKVPDFIGDFLVGADRTGLADKPLVRAVKHWVSEQVQALADKIQQATAKEHKAEDRDKANEGLRKLRDLMKEFLQGVGPTTPPPPPPPPVEYGTVVNELVLEAGASTLALGAGTTIPVLYRAYELDSSGDKKPVKSVACELQSDTFGLVSMTTDGQLVAHSAGATRIWLVHPETGTESNRVDVEIIDCTSAEIRTAPERLLYQGERVTLRCAFDTTSGTRTDLLLQASVDEPNMGRINRHGAFTAGSEEGTATIRVRFGAAAEQTVTQVVRIGPDRMPNPKTGQEGSDLPYILLCGTEVPGMDVYPPEQRTVVASEHYPTVIDYEPQFENVIFINPDSKESIQVRKGKGGPKNILSIGSETYMQFLALKMFEVVKRLYVRQSVKDSAITEQQFRSLFADAEMQCSGFVDRAYTLAHELAANGGR